MTRVLVLGSTGMLGHMVLKVLSREKEWEVKGVSSAEFDAAEYTEIQSPRSTAGRLDLASYDYVINCIGVLVGGDEEKMQRINAEFPRRLAKATSAKIIHISTDGVFSGRPSPQPSPQRGEGVVDASPLLVGEGQGEGYTEDNVSDAADAYGESKLAGEVDALNVLNIRASIIGPSPYKKKGLLEWFLSQPDGATIQGFTNHVWHGVTTLQYAELCVKIIKQKAFDKLRQESHVFHFAPNQPVTKYELLQLFKSVFGKNIKVDRAEDSRGSVERVLKTKYEGIKKLFPHGIKMEEAVEQLARYIRNS